MKRLRILAQSRTRLAVVAASMALLALASPGSRAHATFYVTDLGFLSTLNTNGGVDIIPPGGGAVTRFANVAGATGLTMDSQGNLFVASELSTTISKVTPDGVVTSYGTLAPGVNSSFGIGLAFDSSSGNLYVSNTASGEIDKIGPGGGAGTTFATLGGQPFDLTIDKSGNIYAALSNGSVDKITAAGVVTTLASGLGRLNGITLDQSGNIFVTDTSNNVLDKITQAGVVSTFATGTLYQSFRGLAFDSAGNLFVSNFGGRSPSTVREYDPNGALINASYATGLVLPIDLVITPSAAVPEPSSLALLGVAAAVAIPYHVRRRRRVA